MRKTLTSRGGPLSGVRVVEFSKIWAGPETGKHFAYLGAEVIKIESEESLDGTRLLGASDINKAPGFRAVNPQKLSAQIDVKNPKGVELILQLLAESDIVVESLRPGAMDRLGLGYEAVKAVNPSIVYISMGMWGHQGPLSYQTGYAPCFNALGGLSVLVGYADAQPTGINVRYADSTFGTAAAYSGLVALLHSRNTGSGQFVDVSAVESMTTMIADTVMDYSLTGTDHSCDGNRHSEMAPHNVYRTRDNAWVAIAASTDEAWFNLANVISASTLANDDRFSTIKKRKENEAELDRIIAEWVVTREAAEIVGRLQEAGVAAGKSQNTIDLIADRLLWERNFYRDVTDSDGDVQTTVGPAAKMTLGAEISNGAPILGEHNSYVLGEILGISEEEQALLHRAGATS